MTLRIKLPAASWPLVDQGVISLGTFLFGVVLARYLAIEDYGYFALFLGILMLVQAVSGSALFYPLSVFGAMADDPQRDRLIATTLCATVAVAAPLALLLGLLFSWIIDPSLFLPTAAALVAWQVQEALRRSLLSQFRHDRATIGDGASYFGQVILLIGYASMHSVTLAAALYLMAATSLFGAAIQLGQLAPWRSRPLPLPATLIRFWSIGRWSLGANFLGLARGQSIPWLLTLFAGPAAAGAFQIAANIVNIINPVVTGVCNIIPQAAARANASGSRAALTGAMPYIVAGLPIVGGLALLTIVWPHELLALVYGSTVDAAAIAPAVRILGSAALFVYLSAAICAFLQGIAMGRAALNSDIALTVLQTVAVVPVIQMWGLTGGCLVLAIGFVVRTLLMFINVHIAFGRSAEPTSPTASQPVAAALAAHAAPSQP